MKNIKYCLFALAGVLFMNSCNDDELVPGNPVMDFKTETGDACFGDSLPFIINASDVDVPLSTLKAQLFYGEEKVSETVIRTKTSGEDYTGKIFIPYYANIPDGKATLKFILQNINFTLTEKEQELALVRPDFPYMTFVAEDGQEYKMDRNALYEYSVTAKFSQKMKGYIKSPKVGENGNELIFGWENNEIIQKQDAATIPFSNAKAGKYTISFNSFSYEASPFVKLKINGTELEAIDDDHASIDMNLTTGQELELEGFPNIDNWWIDQDYFEMVNGKLKFLPIAGDYRIIADTKLQWFNVYALKDGELAKLQDDGTGAIWVIGNNVGKPSETTNAVGWTTEKGLCLSQITPKKYQMTLVAGKSINATTIDFKLFSEQGWGGEFSSEKLTSKSDIIGVGAGKEVNGHDNGNLFIKDGKALEENGIYKFVVDVTAGVDKAVLTVEKIGEQAFEEQKAFLNGAKMITTDNAIYTISTNLEQNGEMEFSGAIEDLSDWWVDPDYFSMSADGVLTFNPMSGTYKIKADNVNKLLSAVRMNGTAEATLGDDGHGAIWLMGWGVGSPSLDSQFGWDSGNNYCVAEVAPKKYQFTCTAGPEKGSSIGQRIRFDYLSCKFFFQNGYGGEFSGDNALAIEAGSEAFIADKGNIEFADGAKLEENATYVITVDLTNGNNKGVISFKKK